MFFYAYLYRWGSTGFSLANDEGNPWWHLNHVTGSWSHSGKVAPARARTACSRRAIPGRCLATAGG